MNTYFLHLLERIATVKALRAATGVEVVDRELLISFSGEAEDALVCLIVATDDERTRSELESSRIAADVRQLLLSNGYPPRGVATAQIVVASIEQIKAAGGKRAFFR